MKTLKNIANGSLMVAAIAFSSCSDFLDEVNYSSQSAEEYYATKTGYNSLVTGAYSTLKSVYNNTNYWKLCQLGTDIGTQANGNNTADLNQYLVTYMSDNSEIYSQWTTLYAALKNVNACINRSESVVTTETDALHGMDPAALRQSVAEAKFLRALYLFEIVRSWGKAPLLTEEITTASTEAQLNSGEEFYTQILADLNDVLSSTLPEKQPAGSFGRASKAAARHLRALVYLTRGYQSYGQSSDFENALADADYVINKTGHALLDDYAMVHRQANEANDEVVFAVNFTSTTNYCTNYQSSYYLFSYREGWEGLQKCNYYGNDNGGIMPTKYAYLLFDWNKDRRSQVTFMSPLNGDPATSVDGRTYGRNAFMNTAQLASSTVADTVIYFPVPAEAAFRTYSKEEQLAAATAAKKLFIYNYPAGAQDDWSADDYYITGRMGNSQTTRAWLPVYKFKDAGTMYNEGGTVAYGSRDIVLFRLAETYLIAAEAAVKSNKNSEALKYINAVRSRAANNAPEEGLSLYTGTLTIDDILDERALELYGESSRWNDLTRTGKLAERVLKYNWDATHVTGGVIKTQLSQTTNAKYSLRPLPLSWINTLSNGADISNNEGW